MSLRWDVLCALCPQYNYCAENYGHTCDYADWLEARKLLVLELQGLENEDDAEVE